MDTTPTIQDLKRDALTRRANKLIGWLHRPDYSEYVDDSSVAKIIQVIDLIIWALEKSIPLDEWQRFRNELTDARNILTGKTVDKSQERHNFNAAIKSVITTLQSYLDYINVAELPVVLD